MYGRWFMTILSVIGLVALFVAAMVLASPLLAFGIVAIVGAALLLGAGLRRSGEPETPRRSGVPGAGRAVSASDGAPASGEGGPDAATGERAHQEAYGVRRPA
jgi:hypothetical protein